MKEAVSWAKSRGVEHVIIFGFSTENWNRSEHEVSYFMDMFRRVAKEDTPYFKKEGVRVSVIGTYERFPPDVLSGMKYLEKETTGCK